MHTLTLSRVLISLQGSNFRAVVIKCFSVEHAHLLSQFHFCLRSGVNSPSMHDSRQSLTHLYSESNPYSHQLLVLLAYSLAFYQLLDLEELVYFDPSCLIDQMHADFYQEPLARTQY